MSANEVGTLFRVTVAYAHRDAGAEEEFLPWHLQQLVVRHCGDGMVSVFPANVDLRGRDALVELTPQLSWHEDLFGNCSESPPPPPPTGQWVWPSLPRGLPSADNADDDARAAAEAAQLALYQAVRDEEVMPLIEGAIYELTMRRTPGTFLHQCAQAAEGRALANPKPREGALASRADEVHRLQMAQAHEEIRKLTVEKMSLEHSARNRQRQLLHMHAQQKARVDATSVACAVL